MRTNQLLILLLGLAHVSFAGVPAGIVNPPQSKSVAVGDTVQFQVTATGDAPLFYQWRKDSAVIVGANDSNLLLTNLSAPATNFYSVIVSNAFGAVTSASARLAVGFRPSFNSGPEDMAVTTGASILWSVNLTPRPPAGIALVFATSNQVVSTRDANAGPSITLSFQLNNLQVGQSGQYYFVATNLYGAATSSMATLTITNQAPQQVLLSLSETQATEGAKVIFSGQSFGAPSPEFSLFRDGTRVPLLPPPIQLGRIFIIAEVSLADAGTYTLVASNVAGVASSSVSLAVRRAGPLDRWTVRSPQSKPSLHSVAWGQNQFIAVGERGTILSSADGTNWVPRVSPTTQALRGVTYGQGKFVAVGIGVALASEDGIQWVAGTVPSNQTFYGVTFGNGQFLAASAQPWRSLNGLNWTPVTELTNHHSTLVAATFGSGQFVLTEFQGSVHASADLVNWTSTPGAVLPQIPFAHFTLNEGVLVTLGSGAVHVNDLFVFPGMGGMLNASSNGITWGVSGIITNLAAAYHQFGVAFGNGRYVIVGEKGKITITTNLTSDWLAVPSPSPDLLASVLFANGLFVAVGHNGAIFTSTSGLAWANQTTTGTYDLDGLAVAQGLAIAVGKGGTILTSSNGSAWQRHQLPTPAGTLPPNLHGVTYGQGQWVIVGKTPDIFTSTDALNWQRQPTGLPITHLKRVLFTNGLWIAVGVGGQIITSPDATNWIARASTTTNDLNDVVFAHDQFVAVGDDNSKPNATILTSPDGVTWQNRSLPTSHNARAIGYANGAFVVPLNDNLILCFDHDSGATNGTFGPWQLLGTDVDGANLRGVTWGDGLWVIVGNEGRLLTSTNAASWQARVTPAVGKSASYSYRANLHAVRQWHDTFIAVGNDGTILQSAPLVPSVSIQSEPGQLRLIFHSPREGVFTLQQSDSFNWTDLATITNLTGATEHVVPLPVEAGKKFFRVVTP